MQKMKLSCHDCSNQVWFIMKTRQDKDVIDCIGLVYAKFSRPIGSGAVYEETRQDNDVIDCTSVLYVENKTVWL